MRCLGLDLGSKTLGIAISDLTNSIASIYTTLNIAEDDYESLILPLKKIILEEDVDTLVLGFPKNMDNSIGKKGQLSIEFKKKLEVEANTNISIQIKVRIERNNTQPQLGNKLNIWFNFYRTSR